MELKSEGRTNKLSRRGFLNLTWRIGLGLGIGAVGASVIAKPLADAIDTQILTNDYNNTHATAIAISTPENAKKIFETFPQDTIKNSVQILLNFQNKDKQGSTGGGGSGMTILQKGEYQVILTAAHVLTDENDETVSVNKIAIRSPQIDKFQEVFDSSQFWFFTDPNKDIGIVVIKNPQGSQNSPDFALKVDKDWNISSSDIYALSYPSALNNSGAAFVPVKVNKDDISKEDQYVNLNTVSIFGASGAVFCNSNGNIVSVMTNLNYGGGVISIPVGHSVDSLIRQASSKLEINLSS